MIICMHRAEHALLLRAQYRAAVNLATAGPLTTLMRHEQLPRFTRISTNSSCCKHVSFRWPFRQRQDQGMIVVINGSTVLHGASQSDCEAICRTTLSCTFFSYSREARVCAFCSACELRPPGDEWRTASRAATRVSSWARLAAHDFARVAVGHNWIESFVQGNYSRLIYGAEGRVPLESLRVMWMDLLDRAGQRAVADFGVCKMQPAFPEQPLFMNIDRDTNVNGAVWVFQPRLRFAADHEWVEVLHCPRRCDTLLNPFARGSRAPLTARHPACTPQECMARSFVQLDVCQHVGLRCPRLRRVAQRRPHAGGRLL